MARKRDVRSRAGSDADDARRAKRGSKKRDDRERTRPDSAEVQQRAERGGGSPGPGRNDAGRADYGETGYSGADYGGSYGAGGYGGGGGGGGGYWGPYGVSGMGGAAGGGNMGGSTRWGGWGGTYGDSGSYGSWGGRVVQPNHAGRGPRSYHRSDERIREDINEALTRHPGVDATDIEVRVSDGQITLSGTVEDRNAKRIAEDVAYSITGAEDVNNELHVQRGGARQDQTVTDREVPRRTEQEGGSRREPRSASDTTTGGASAGER